jgi:hypothetical protein
VSYSQVLTYDTASNLSFDTSLVEIGGGVLRLKDLGGGTYSTANPVVSTGHRTMLSSLTSFAESKSVTGSDEVKYQVVIGTSTYYYNTSSGAWAVSDGSYSQSNTAAQLNSNASTLFSGLSLSDNIFFRVNILLHSASGSSRPSLTSNTIGYQFTTSSPSTISQCLVTCYLKNLQSVVPTYDSTKPVTLNVKANRAFMHGNNFIQPFAKSAVFNASGVAQLSIIETTTPTEYLGFYVSYYEGNSVKSVKLFNALVPNSPSADLSSVTSVRDADFG